MRFGADYYPEHWPEERWETDARLMQEAGFNTVRLAEFAWVKMEAEAGRFDFGWLEKALDILHARGIQAVIGTPTAAPPAWLCTSSPEILRIDETRQQVTFGNRQHYCVNQPEFRKASDRIVAAMAKALSGHPGVFGWQIDNEFGPMCYCEECRRQFQEWLAARYGTLDALDSAWGTAFWSQTYTDWAQIPLPWKRIKSPNPGLALDYRRFFSDSFASFQQSQIDIIRAQSDKPITHNFMGLSPEVLNYQQLADQLDFAAWDSYPFGNREPAVVSVSHDLTRACLRKPFWVMEQMSGPGGWAEMTPMPRPGRIREWTYHAIGRGADGIIYFRWRPCRSGTEQYWHGILNHDGSTNRRYEEIKRTGAEIARIGKIIDGSEIRPQVAFINDYDSRWAFQYQRGNPALSYVEGMLRFYRGFHSRSIPVDVITRTDDLAGYKLVVAPLHFVLTRERAQHFRDYVAGGGTLVTTFRSAVKDDTSLIFDEPLPGRLQDVFGAVVEEYHSPPTDEVNTLRGLSGDIEGMTSECGVWLDMMRLQCAESLADFESGFIMDQPHRAAVTRNEFGRGKAYYIGTLPSQDFANALMGMIASNAGIQPGVETPAGVDASLRTSPSGGLLFLVNHTDQPRQVTAPSGYTTDILTDSAVSATIELAPYGVAVLR